MSIEVELGEGVDLTQQVALITAAVDDQVLQQQMQQAIALKAGQSAATTPSKGSPYLIYGLLGVACVGYWALNRAERRA